MGETPNYLVKNEIGCGFVGALFNRRGFRPRQKPVPSLPAAKSHNSIKNPSSKNPAARSHNSVKNPTSKNPKRRRSSSGEMKFLESSKSANPPPKQGRKPLPKPTVANPRSSTSSSKNSSLNSGLSQVTNVANTRRLMKEPTFTSSEMSMSVAVREKPSINGTLYRASSGNTMLLGHLGNVRQSRKENPTANNVKTLEYHLTAGARKHSEFGNIYRGPMNKLDPEALKSMGNENYKKGRFEDALALYNQAIALDSSKASYYSNRSAALIGLGRLIEAVFDCRVAIKIEPSYHRAHQRLAELYIRLGEAEQALYHYKHSGPKADTKDISQAQALKIHLSRCNETQKQRNWNELLKESRTTISLGADSAPQVYAMQTEALLELRRHQEAYSAIKKGPNFGIDFCTQFFGSAVSAHLLAIWSRVYMATGRFEDAVTTAHSAARLDPSDVVTKIAKRARALASARSSGNQLFKASKFSQACIAYSEGLEHEPFNSVLLCNRAACRSKLGQFEKAVEDCTAALYLQPSYTKARQRRADCYVKLERWEAAIQDYEVLTQETPRDEVINRALYVAQIQLKKQQSEDLSEMKLGTNLVQISS
ncbi:hypothetical protein RJ640_006640 [Escallonia rubra]|uniref:Inactive TPR repeat-containing thioredoxin TTL3-like n=1 Tax=Escallonia rubra TaxID=112253 RepID=A0AA88RCF5_9ASTE|nr:hypothetical protein RJ640_006640 [Escallonia rubra]